jgi:hypothetical protein
VTQHECLKEVKHHASIANINSAIFYKTKSAGGYFLFGFIFFPPFLPLIFFMAVETTLLSTVTILQNYFPLFIVTKSLLPVCKAYKC